VIGRISYDGFGKIVSDTTGASADRYKYTGREWDSVVSLQYNRARYYDPAIGKWTSTDPLAFNAGDGNLYRYCGNGPTIGLDPLGAKVVLIFRPAGSLGFGIWFNHIQIVVIDEENHQGVVFEGGGPGSGGAFGIGVGKPNTTGVQEGVTIDPELGDQVVVSDGDFETELEQLMGAYDGMQQIPVYLAYPGPNSNTFAHQLLENAGFAVPDFSQNAPGWDYHGENGYGGPHFDTNGKPKPPILPETPPYSGFPPTGTSSGTSIVPDKPKPSPYGIPDDAKDDFIKGINGIKK
jgi:RHS repeat-associated protein